jgi:hypothetical protein
MSPLSPSKAVLTLRRGVSPRNFHITMCLIAGIRLPHLYS